MSDWPARTPSVVLAVASHDSLSVRSVVPDFSSSSSPSNNSSTLTSSGCTATLGAEPVLYSDFAMPLTLFRAGKNVLGTRI